MLKIIKENDIIYLVNIVNKKNADTGDEVNVEISRSEIKREQVVETIATLNSEISALNSAVKEQEELLNQIDN